LLTLLKGFSANSFSDYYIPINSCRESIT